MSQGLATCGDLRLHYNTGEKLHANPSISTPNMNSKVSEAGCMHVFHRVKNQPSREADLVVLSVKGKKHGCSTCTS